MTHRPVEAAPTATEANSTTHGHRRLAAASVAATLVAILGASACGGAAKPAETTSAANASGAGTPAAAPATAVPEPFGPELARRDPVQETIHDTIVYDHYRWLEDADSPETKAWMAKYDEATRTHLGALPGRAALKERLDELSYVDWVGSPSREGNRYFFKRRHADKEKSIWYWREGKTGEPNVLLDPNTMSDDGSISLSRSISPSHDGKLVAYKLSENNADHATIHVMNVKSGKVSKIDEIPGGRYAYPSWNADSTGFYYVRLPVDPNIPVADLPGYAEVAFHKLGTDPATDEVIYGKTGDARIFLGTYVSRDGRYLFVEKMHGWTKTDVFFKDLKRHKKFQPLAVGIDARFDVWPWKDRFYVRTNLDAPHWRMLRIDPKQPEQSAWEEIVPADPKAVLEGVSIVGGKLSLQYLQNASNVLKIAELDGKPVRTIELPALGTAGGLKGHPEDDTAYFSYSSFTQPHTIFETSVSKGGREVYFELDVPVDPKPFDVEQVWYTSKDGTKVSMFLVHRKDMVKDGSTPFLLYGYGGFNISLTPRFSGSQFVWLEQGGGLAIPNLRGGGEYGEDWHESGMLTKKQNVFDDFTSAAEYLIAEGYTKSERLAISGRSNGGLLVGAAMTQHPELFRAVTCGVPLLDMVRYHKFGSGRTWITEYGSAEDPVQFKALHAYSPYHHVEKGTEYPALLMLSADSDDRVDPMHARKFVAAAQYANASENPILLRIETNAGHGGGDMVKKRVARLTDEYSFLFHELGMPPRAEALARPSAPSKCGPRPARPPRQARIWAAAYCQRRQR